MLKHKFFYEIEYKRSYELVHKLYKDAVTSEDWRTAMMSIELYTFHRLGDVQILSVALIKEIDE